MKSDKKQRRGNNSGLCLSPSPEPEGSGFVPEEQKHLFACVQLHSTSPGPGAKTNFARNHNSSHLSTVDERPAVALDKPSRRQIKAPMLECKYCAGRMNSVSLLSLPGPKDTANNSGVKFYSCRLRARSLHTRAHTHARTHTLNMYG